MSDESAKVGDDTKHLWTIDKADLTVTNPDPSSPFVMRVEYDAERRAWKLSAANGTMPTILLHVPPEADAPLIAGETP